MPYESENNMLGLSDPLGISHSSNTTSRSKNEVISELTATTSPENADIEEPRFRAEYAIWKKNTPFLYDMILTTRLPWPSLTLEWLPEVEIIGSSSQIPSNPKSIQSSLARYKLLLGTQTSGTANEYVRIGAVDLPSLDPRSQNPTSLLNQYDPILGEFGGYQTSRTQFKMHQLLEHSGEVNRARYLPQNPSIVATASSDGLVYLFDCTKHPLDPRNNTSSSATIAAATIASATSSASRYSGLSESVVNSAFNKSFGVPNPRPDMIMQSHSSEVSSLSWNQFKHGILASGSFDRTVVIWDIKTWRSGSHLAPASILKTHQDIINDLEWHQFNPALLGSVSDDGEIHIHDTRAQNASTTPQLLSVPISYKNLSGSSEIIGINSISFNPANENLLATGGTDGNVVLWDLRSLNSPLHVMHGHADNINSVKWSPHDPVVLASASSDRRVCVWDVSRVGDDRFSQRDVDDDVSNGKDSSGSQILTAVTPSPELLWVHGGHTESVSDIAWNPALPWVLSSVSNDNHLHIYKPAQSIVKTKM